MHTRRQVIKWTFWSVAALAPGYGLLFDTPLTIIVLPLMCLIGGDFAWLFGKIFKRKSV